MTDATAKPELYPQYCFRLSPTVNHWCHLRISDILALRSHRGFEGQDVYFHLNHPIKWVRICGIVVAVDERATKHLYTIDDGSGATIECVVNLAPPPNPVLTTTTTTNSTLPPSLSRPIDVGHLLDIKGGLGTFRDNLQVLAEKVAHLASAEPEVVFWEKAARLRREVLARPWVLERREIRWCRKEEERGGKSAGHGRRRGGGEGRGRGRTGLERVEGGKAVVRKEVVRKAVVKAGLEETRLEEPRSRKTGLERTQSRTTVPKQTGPERISSRTTGLERTAAKEPGVEATGSPKPRLKTTGLERMGLARTQPRRTGLEGAASRPPAPKKTGLERQKTTGLERPSSSPGQSWSSSSHIRKPLAERPARVTGLEKRKAPAPATREIPIPGKYDALGL